MNKCLEKGICLYFVEKYKNNLLRIKEITDIRYFKEEKYIIAVSSIDKVVHL